MIAPSMYAMCRQSGWICILLVVHAGLLAWNAVCHSPTINEIGHLPAGIAHWKYGKFELYRVNPPLPRMIAALPVLASAPRTDWSNYPVDALADETLTTGMRFVKANGARAFQLFTRARWAGIPFCLIGAWTCFQWAKDLWGPSAGYLAAVLWCFDPLILGHGALVMPDVPAAALGVFAAYRFAKWLRRPVWSAALVAGLSLGLAELCKTLLIVFFAAWPLAWLTVRLQRRWRDGTAIGGTGELAQLGLILLSAIYVINCGYGFTGSCQRLGDFRFRSRLLAGCSTECGSSPGNRFAASKLAWLPVPLPRDYLQGIDRQRADFEDGGKSYLCETWKPRGWWHYYLAGLALKTPCGTLIIVLLASVLSLCSRRRSTGEGWLLLISAGAVLALLSCQTGFSHHIRYAIPALPFLFIWAAQSASAVSFSLMQFRKAPLILSWSAAIATAVSSLFVYPHSLSYFNELAGGAQSGHKYLLGSNLASGQDLLFLREWIAKNPNARPLRLAALGFVDPTIAGIEFVAPAACVKPNDRLDLKAAAAQIPPGWYVIDANLLYDAPAPVVHPGWRMEHHYAAGRTYEHFRFLKPCDRIAFSYFVFRVAEEQEAVRQSSVFLERKKG